MTFARVFWRRMGGACSSSIPAATALRSSRRNWVSSSSRKARVFFARKRCWQQTPPSDRISNKPNGRDGSPSRPKCSHGALSPCDASTERGGYNVWDTSRRGEQAAMCPYQQRMKQPAETTGLRSMLRAFRHRNFRLFFSGQSISLVGTWVQQIALSWTVYQLTRSSFLLGLVSFAGQLPLFMVTPFAGVWVERWSRHRTLMVTQTLSMLQAFALAAVVLTGFLGLGTLIFLNAFAGVVLAIDLTARQAFMVEMVGSGHDLPNAVALNAFIINGGRMLGPAIAGLLLTIVSPAICFLINAISYIPVIAALMAMRVKARPQTASD